MDILESLAHIRVGYHAPKGIKENPDGDYYIIQSKDFNKYNRLCKDTMLSFFPERKPELYMVKKGDILFQARGMTHFAYCVKEELDNIIVSSSFYIITIKNNNIIPEYFAWWLNRPVAQTFINSQARGISISYISKKVISQLKIKIPPTTMQQKIVKIIELKNKEQELLSRLAVRREQLVNALCMKAIQ